MKIFYKNDYMRAVARIEKLNKVIELKNKFIWELLEREHNYEDLAKKLKKANEKQLALINSIRKEHYVISKELEELKEKYRKLSNSKGGLIKHINKLENELKEKDLMIADLKSDRYLRVTLPADKPKTQKIKCNGISSSRNSEIIRKIKR